MNLSLLYQNAFRLVQHGTIEDVQKLAYAFFDRPIAICDTSFEMLVPDYPNSFQNDELWDIPNQTLRVPYEHVKMLQDHQLIEKVISHPHQTICCNWGWFKSHPRLTTGVFMDEHLMAYIAVLLDQEPYPPEFDEALQVIADTFSFILYKQKRIKSKTVNQKELIARELFTQKLSPGEIQSILDNRYIMPKNNYYLIAAHYCQHQDNFDQVISTLQFYDVLYFVQEDVLFILISCLDEFIHHPALQYLIRSQYQCAVSAPFQDLGEIHLYQQQAAETLQVCQKLNLKFNVYYFLDYALDILKDKIKDEAFLIHPLLKELKDYDKKHHTQYFETLKVYINYSRQIEECLQRLHIHRNTLFYRLHKIEELYQIDLNHPDTLAHLYISFMIE